MKKKLLVLSASAILASNFIFDNNASAVARDSNYKSNALEVKGNIKSDISLKSYLDSLNSLATSLSVGSFSGYDQPEYKDAYQRYQNRFLAEIEATVKFVLEDGRKVDYIKNNDYVKENGKLGLTHERYNRIYENLKKNRNDFDRDVYLIEESNNELKRFDRNQQASELRKVYDLEDKIYMIAKAFSEREHIGARVQLFNKLNLIVGYLPEERSDKLPTNQRMVNEMCEDLETIIDEFFQDIGYKRPTHITPLTEENKDDLDAVRKVREAAEQAKNNNDLVDPGVQQRVDRAAKRLAKLKEASTEASKKAEKLKSTVKYLKAEKGQTEFSYKQLSQKAKNKLSIKYPDTNIQLPTYTESITQTPQPVLKQQKREETFTLESAPRLNQSKPLNGLNGESHFVTMDESSNASTQFGSNGHVFEYSFDSTPKTTNVTKQNVKQENYNSVNNLAGMSGESQHVDFTQDSHPTTTYGGYGNAFDFTEDTAPKQPETITESHEIVFDEYTDVTVSGYTKGESIEDTNVPTQTNQKN
ncbi:hypothetical protein BUZ56_02005 [Staphylococcus hyicus]|uniref:coagulase domain-containing protein n=1 Tax=Staphylococcus hyicus TaxID=1284 RepID=UPI000D1E8F87|nr:coagulase domain-containing protein [Staphylococcus hyicus]MCQ9301450.1 hypothetical protein [Staphylococcus hyicus]PTJ70658.1 hypothetical protein BUZ58_09950 [Staphylococcus hyicus]PTJ89504.1 hypothetical protein BUZ56_02005 [Staphylococcus hyicus]